MLRRIELSKPPHTAHAVISATIRTISPESMFEFKSMAIKVVDTAPGFLGWPSGRERTSTNDNRATTSYMYYPSDAEGLMAYSVAPESLEGCE